MTSEQTVFIKRRLWSG